MIAVTSATTLFSILILSPSIAIINEKNSWNNFLSSIFHHLKWKFVIFLVENRTDIKEEIIVQLHDSHKSSVVISVAREGLVQVPTSLDFLYEEEKSIKAVVDVNLGTFKTFLRKINKHPMLWSSDSYWLIKSENLWFLKDRNFSNLINKEINIAFTVFNNTKETFLIYSLNCEENVGPLSFNVIDWNKNASNEKSIFYKKPRYVKDLKGKKFKFALEKHFPFYLPPKNIKFPKPSGIDIYLLDILSRRLNFSYDIVRPADKKWGSKHNGTWNGMIGMIEKQEVRGALGGMSVIASRVEVADFSKSYAFDRIAFVIRSPEETSRKWVIFRPFTWDVWLAVTIAILVVAICLFVIENIIWHSAEIYKSRYDVKLKNLKIVKAILLIYKSVVYQDCYDPTSNSGRVLIVFWWIFVITLIAGYSGTLVSFMANPGRETPVDTISKLVSVLKSGQFSCGTISDSASHEIFRFKTFLRKINKHPMLWSSDSYWLIKSENLWFLKDRNFSNLINKEINIAFTVFNNTKETFLIYSLNCEENVGPLSFNVIDWNKNASNEKSIFYKKPRYVKDLKGKKFKFALEKHFPFYLPPKNIKFPKPSGIDIYLLDILSRRLNFSYDIVRPADKKWGSKHNGTWNGMIGMIEKQEVRGALGGMSVIASRVEVADFSKSYAFDRIAFVIRSPEETSRKWVIFRPFTWDYNAFEIYGHHRS
ncbi:uncharacterized protein LOC111632512 [Centruroides sculpturatus]|uniref:uncharacterized protein LOC111632512 n=1 Tax=Centruroides sculpturatus TaxID=218467 RepID=UPI000C6CB661|nr:uncharacterized protein LOC111632512 [Centruroides sculpturatus]